MRKIFGDKPAGKIVILCLSLGLFISMNYFASRPTMSKWFVPSSNRCECGLYGCLFLACAEAECDGTACHDGKIISGCRYINPACPKVNCQACYGSPCNKTWCGGKVYGSACPGQCPTSE